MARFFIRRHIRLKQPLIAFAAVASVTALQQAHAEVAPQKQPTGFLLPSFSTPDYECDGLRAVQMQRQPSKDKNDAFDVILVDQGGAEMRGDVAGVVGWKTDSTITVIGTVTLSSCKPDGPKPVVITGKRLRFRVSSEGRLEYVDGTGTVNQLGKTTKLPLAASTRRGTPKSARSRPNTAGQKSK